LNSENNGSARDQRSNQSQSDQDKGLVAPPVISLPKGGGAIRGMGEKFAANPVTGAGSMTVPIAVSPGRSGFGPQLSLSYDSGGGNGPFGFGWNLSLPAITRKTDKGLPQYRDSEDSNVFILSGAEDLVPVFRTDTNGNWVRDDHGNLVIHEDTRTIHRVAYQVRRYRPRIEGLFARIERWTNPDKPAETFWRSISKDNITTWYGKTEQSCIVDPADPTRIFSWLICESYDDKGNLIAYEYNPENSDDIDVTQAHERNRTDARGANRYLKRILYGNLKPYFPELSEHAAWPALPSDDQWMFKVVFDYDDHDQDAPTPRDDEKKDSDGEKLYPWRRRKDAFSSYRAGFEVRTYRLCQRVLMFHHFPAEAEVGANCLVRSTDFNYSYEQNPTDPRNPIFSFLRSVTQSGYKRQGGAYLRRSLPPLEFEYTTANIDETIHEIDPESLDNLPYGIAGGNYQWIDLDGEGLAGILTEQAEGWFYKRNLGPINLMKENGIERAQAKFAPVELVGAKPNAAIAGGQAQFMDLAGDGQPDLVLLDAPTPGFYEHDEGAGWNTFRAFSARLNRNTRDPNLKFVDLDGDGHADALITEDEAFTWHPSLGEEGFGPAERVSKAWDEEKGPAIVFADATQSIYLADLSGDGLTDLVRIRNGEVCYWPNLGYGRFGARVTMDNSPWFDAPDLFDQRRIRLADIDGSGVTDIIYLHGAGIRLYFNQSGNSWGDAQKLELFPRTDNLSSVTVVDLLGNGTACLVWSSPLPGDARRQMRYVDLMGGQKPHLMISSKNNLGAETRVQYAPSTKFYLQDRRDGKPWITRLPFPVHVIERVETFDHISHNQFVSLYKYHHGYFDGEEREFRGFGMVEQWDTDEFNKLNQAAANVDRSWHMPPVHTKTWFHTGAYLRGQEISLHLAREYFGAPKDKTEFEKWLNDTLLPDTVFPDVPLSADEQRQACRALKGAMLRQEVYADDGSAKEGIPYTVTEQNFTIERVQPQAKNRYAVFFTHSREAISYHYERDLDDPRVTHAMTLEADAYGNVLRSLAIGYQRNGLPGTHELEQQATHITLSANRFANRPNETDWYRIGLPVESRMFEIVKLPAPQLDDEDRVMSYSFDSIRTQVANLFPIDAPEPEMSKIWPYEKWDWRTNPVNAPLNMRLRLIEHARTLYRKDDLTALLNLGEVGSLALPGESYKLALTPGLLTTVYKRRLGSNQPEENLIPPDPSPILRMAGGYILSNDLKGMRLFPATDPDGHWWIPSGRVFFAPAGQPELREAQQHFYLPRRFRDPFGKESTVDYDSRFDLLPVSTTDALNNTISSANDYRVLAPYLVTDPNGNRTEVKFDVLGMVAATAVMGKTSETQGDLLANFAPDLSKQDLNTFFANPRVQAESLLGDATTRIIYDLDRFMDDLKPPFAATISRETHVSEPTPAGGTKYQVGFSYSDGFGREIQKKIQAERGPLDLRNPAAPIVNPRWVGSGWTIFNNKGKPVRQYEPFFDDTHDFKFGHKVGVSTILFYDPVERVVATLHPNHTYEKVVFDPWEQTTWDVNDTTKAPDDPGDPPFDPKDDPDVGRYFGLLPDDEYLPTWHALRTHSAYATKAAEKWPDAKIRDAERDAADKAADHAKTPTTAHLDTLGRPFLTYAHNGFEPNNVLTPILFATQVKLDIEGNQLAVIDAKDRIVMRYDYDMLGARIHQISMEAGERWMLNNIAGKPIRGWNSRRFDTENEYDALQRPNRVFVTGEWNETPNVRTRKLVEEIVYGENRGADKQKNLRGKVYQHFDTAGIVTNVEYDFKGNLRESSRKFLSNYKATPDWNSNPTRENEIFASQTQYDALNRPTSLTTPDGSVHHPTFNEANLLDKIDVNLRGASVATPFVTNIDYNAKGQRVKIEYGNHAVTTYEYDEETFRLTNLKTTRPPGRNGMSSQLFESPTIVQDLHYVYDPAGNITRIADDAVKTVFNGIPIDAIAQYTYDPIYRLIEATGREHIPQTEFNFTPNGGNYRDYPFWGHQANPNDPRSLQNYTEIYEYDAVGNFDKVIHKSSNPATPGWTRSYDYVEASLIEDGRGGAPLKISNRLSSTTINGTGANRFTENYSYDEHGNMNVMSHLPVMQWDFRDQLLATAQQRVNSGTPETTWYVYDSSGQRVRKVTDNASNVGNASKKEERIYLGGFEIYRKNGTNPLVRETLHIMDDKQRITLVETRTDTQASEQLIRYQFCNHLGSASLELDEQALIISYEEYAPYGSSTYQAVRSQTETAKWYRYMGKERDEESGLYYHGSRYYAAWMGKWVSTDPEGLVDGANLFKFVACNPVRYIDMAGKKPKQAPLISTEPEFRKYLETRKDDPMMKLAKYAGELPAEEDIKHRKLYFSKVGHEQVGGTTIPLGWKYPETTKDEKYVLGYPDYRIGVVMNVGKVPLSYQDMDVRMDHERKHLEIKLAVKESEERIAAENKALGTGLMDMFLATDLETLGATQKEGRKRVVEEMKQKFYADVTQEANEEVLVYSQAFNELYKKGDKASAMKELIGILGDEKTGNYFSKASDEARHIAIDNIVGTESTAAGLRRLKESFIKTFKDKEPVNLIVNGKPTFYKEVVNALEDRIANREAIEGSSRYRKR
jgi:RHS repeat-associated protein